MRLTLVAAVILLVGGCMPSRLKVFPAPPPGSAASMEEEAKELTEGADGSIYNLGSKPTAAALRKVRAFCGGPFTVLEERVRRVMTPLSFPIPENRHYTYFRCGVEAEEPED